MEFIKKKRIIQIRADWGGLLRAEFFSLGFEGKKRPEHLKVGKNSSGRRNSTENQICGVCGNRKPFVFKGVSVT